MSECVIIAIVGALINMILSLLIPCLFKNTQQPILVSIKKVYAAHKQSIIISTIIVFITIYLALKLTPELGFSFDNDISLNPRNMDYSLNSRSGLGLDDFFSQPTNAFKPPTNTSGFRIVNLSRL
jgi:hypothetical protein